MPCRPEGARSPRLTHAAPNQKGAGQETVRLSDKLQKTKMVRITSGH